MWKANTEDEGRQGLGRWVQCKEGRGCRLGDTWGGQVVRSAGEAGWKHNASRHSRHTHHFGRMYPGILSEHTSACICVKKLCAVIIAHQTPHAMHFVVRNAVWPVLLHFVASWVDPHTEGSGAACARSVQASLCPALSLPPRLPARACPTIQEFPHLGKLPEFLHAHHHWFDLNFGCVAMKKDCPPLPPQPPAPAPAPAAPSAPAGLTWQQALRKPPSGGSGGGSHGNPEASEGEALQAAVYFMKASQAFEVCPRLSM